MPTTIQQIKNENKEIIETALDVKIHKKLSDTMYIAVDNTAHIALSTNQDLQESLTYKLLKPKLNKSVLEANPKFKLLKTKVKLNAKVLNKTEMKAYEEFIELENKRPSTTNHKNLNNFSKFEALCNETKSEKLTLLIVSKSSDIDGKYGKYNIVTAKDCNGEKNSIAIYHDKQKVVCAQKVLTFTTLKKTTFKPSDAAFHRLATVWNTRIFEAKQDEVFVFQNILLGDEKVEGLILGYEDFVIYESCIKCSTKLLEDFCKKCDKNVEEQKKNDFFVTLYAQEIKNEENIMDLFAFKRDINVGVNEAHEFEKIVDELTGKRFVIEFNKPEGEGKLKLVKMKQID